MANDQSKELFTNELRLQDELDTLTLTDDETLKPEELREAYAEELQKSPFNDKARADEIMAAPLNKPIFRQYDFHPEDLPKRTDLLQIATDVAMDISYLDNKIINTTNDYTKLISSTINRLNMVKQRLMENKQRVEDINFICNAYNGLANVVPIDNLNMTGVYAYTDQVFTAFAPNMEAITPTVLSVSGNGYIGNAHVLADRNTYQIEEDDRADITKLTDSSALTVFEYSRICSRDNTGKTIDDVNYDDKDVTCTIELYSDGGFNMIKLEPDYLGISIKDVLTSNDGTRYVSALSKDLDLNANMYQTFDYVPGCNSVYFPETSYAKIVLSGSDYRIEDLGYTYTDVSNGKPVTHIEPIPNAVRKVIALGGLGVYHSTYRQSTMITSDLAPSSGCNRVAVFANQYIPELPQSSEGESRDYITYELLVNGKTYQVTPINSTGGGIKIISNEKNSYLASNTKFIDEKIKTVQLRITIQPIDKYTAPFIGNLKVCFG